MKFCKKIKKRDNSENSVSEKVKNAPGLLYFPGFDIMAYSNSAK